MTDPITGKLAENVGFSFIFGVSSYVSIAGKGLGPDQNTSS